MYLNVRKWLGLGLMYLAHGCAALFVVRFLDSIRYIPFNKIQGILCIAGCDHIVKSHTDIEPVIRVPIADMKIL